MGRRIYTHITSASRATPKSGAPESDVRFTLNPKQKKHWNLLLDLWDKSTYACLHETARLYTKKYPDDPYGWVLLADSLNGFGLFEKARDALRNALRLSPPQSRSFVYHQTGHHYKEKGDLKRAEHWYQKALKEKPTTDHHLFLGACLAKQGKYGEAKKHHLIASKNKDGKGSPDEAFFNLGLIYRAERNYKKAIECFENAIEIDPNYTKAKKAKADVSKIQYYLKKI